MKYLYHIAKATDWSQAQTAGLYQVSSLTRSFDKDGFIHLAYAYQVHTIADLIYSETPDLQLLTIDPTKLKAEVKDERANYPDNLFPHLYGPLNIDAVVRVGSYSLLPTGKFPIVQD